MCNGDMVRKPICGKDPPALTGLIMCGRYAITLPPEAVRQLFQTHGDATALLKAEELLAASATSNSFVGMEVRQASRLVGRVTLGTPAALLAGGGWGHTPGHSLRVLKSVKTRIHFRPASASLPACSFGAFVPLADIVARPDGRRLSRQPAGAEPAGQPASILLSAIEEFLEV